jgi:hypothetical protein
MDEQLNRQSAGNNRVLIDVERYLANSRGSFDFVRSVSTATIFFASLTVMGVIYATVL